MRTHGVSAGGLGSLQWVCLRWRYSCGEQAAVAAISDQPARLEEVVGRHERCVWCNRGGNLVELSFSTKEPLTGSPVEWTVFVHAEHGAFVDRSVRRLSRWGTTWFVLVMTGVGAAPLVGMSIGWPFAALLPALIGILIIALPFATPTTGRLFGMCTAQRVARVLGLLVVLGGVLGFVALQRLERQKGAAQSGDRSSTSSAPGSVASPCALASRRSAQRRTEPTAGLPPASVRQQR